MQTNERTLALTNPITLVLRAEAGAAFVAALVFFALSDFSWALFAFCFLLPDVSLLAYIAGPQRGALVYNAAHTYAAPLLFGAACALTATTAGVAVATVWVAHIAFDRALGLGLKYGSNFKDTHLGGIGRR
jgi:hypothetical protein